MSFLYESTEIKKSLSDTNEYKYIVLKNNLKVLLISDPSTDKSGCSLAVKVGSFNEPNDINGLAHFLEHLLFMGTEKYPDENDYMDFLSLHNGSSNAYTSDECTVYYFDICNMYFKEALDRFAQFYISPLFSKSSVDREKMAVHSEFLSQLNNDEWRLYRILSLCFKDNLPESRFSTGNKDTLYRDDIRKRVIDFYHEEYSSHKIVCVMYSNQRLEDMENILSILEKIKDIRDTSILNGTSILDDINTTVKDTNKNIEDKISWYNNFDKYISDTQIQTSLWKSNLKNKLIRYKSVGDTNTLTVFIKTVYSYVNYNMYSLIQTEFCMEDYGCIRILKDKGLVYDIHTHIDTVKDYSLFNINLYLTDIGLEKVEEVLNVIHQYFINLEISEDKMRRVIDHNRINFQYKDKEDVIDILDNISEKLCCVPVLNIFTYEYGQEIPQQEMVDCVLSMLRDRNEWITLLGVHKYKFDRRDLIFDLEYSY